MATAFQQEDIETVDTGAQPSIESPVSDVDGADTDSNSTTVSVETEPAQTEEPAQTDETEQTAEPAQPETQVKKGKGSTKAAPAATATPAAPAAPAPNARNDRGRQATKGRPPINPLFLMLPMPDEKKTNSRPGIARKMQLCSRLAQELYFRTYEKVSDANNFLEKVYPGMVDGRGEGRNKAVVVEGFAEIVRAWTEIYEDANNHLDSLLDSVRERLESEGIDPSHIETEYTEILEEKALVTTKADLRFLGLLEKIDRVLSFMAAASLYDVYTAEEAMRMERDLRARMITLYRMNIRYRAETGALLKTGKTATMRREDRQRAQDQKAQRNQTASTTEETGAAN